MNNDQKRAAIAEACGAKWYKTYANNFRSLKFNSNLPKWELADGTEEIYRDYLYGIPDYLNDLSACREMEKALKPYEQLYYGQHLNTVLGRPLNLDGDTQNGGDDVFAIAHATAAQKCEAFLRTKSLFIPDADAAAPTPVLSESLPSNASVPPEGKS